MNYNNINRHNFNPSYKLHLCCSEDGLRPVMEYVHFTEPHFHCSNNKFESKYGNE